MKSVTTRFRVTQAMIESSAQKIQPTEMWSVVVLYEDKATRERAMGICDDLIRQFWAEVEFDFRWWRTDFLVDAAMAKAAATDARVADFIIFCSHPESDLSPTLTEWFASWAEQRAGQPGALLDLTHEAGTPAPYSDLKQIRLRELAQRATLDYLTEIPSVLSSAAPESLESVATRATRVTEVLDEILHYPAPPRFGLNE
jgi:hypothetical protein